jgi:acetylornithine/N-succinyldiaminopimelate aminotransferase
MDALRWPTYKTRSIVLDRPLESTTRGSAYVVDTEGRTYLDCVGGIGCAPLGHGDPRWVEAISTQLSKVAAAANSYQTAPQRAFAAALLERMPIADARVFLCSTGTESTEAAIKLAVKATGRDIILSFERAFHGRSLGALALTANPAYRQPYVRCLEEDGAADAFAQMKVARVPFGDLEAARELCERYRGRIAAVFLEPIQGEAGIFPATKEFLLGLRALCDSHGALLGIDEIQSGCGRTGHFTAWETIVGDAAEPDIIWMAKALGGGFPVAACIARTQIAQAMQPGTHGTTFGGNPVACAAGLATLTIIEQDGLMSKAAAQRGILEEIAATDPLPVPFEIRGVGAMLGVGLGAPEDKIAAPLGSRMPELGVLVTVCGGHTVRSLLPFFAGREELTKFWSTLKQALEA